MPCIRPSRRLARVHVTGPGRPGSWGPRTPPWSLSRGQLAQLAHQRGNLVAEAHGFRDTPVTPHGARWDHELGEFVLPYEIVGAAPDPDALLLEFLQSSYEGAQ